MACTLKTYRTCNLTIGFSKHEFNKNLLSNVTLIRVTSNVNWIWERERERERERCRWLMHGCLGGWSINWRIAHGANALIEKWCTYINML